MFERETDHDPLAARRHSRRVIWGLVALGCVAYVAGLALDRPLVGVGIYWLCGLGFMAYGSLTDTEPYDERDREIMANAAGTTLTVAAFALIAGAPGMAALQAAGVATAPAAFWGAMFALAGVFGVYAVATQYHERQT
ncbi:hypothetical protein [Halorubellus sp. PRR65]|uniref:hypothetical protein n=1 Tax=Halorubellus sp. PRR65 TaxID=3098148 RepID=UPI002B257069|nr:hypothetical protein [Halorubellus sp. PRR65]